MAEKTGRLPIDRVLTNSLRNSWTGCHRRFYYANIEGLEPIVVAPALSLGKAWHRGLEAVYRAVREGVRDGTTLQGFAATAINEDAAAYLKTLEDLPDAGAADAAAQEGRQHADTAVALIRMYLQTWAGTLDRYKVIHVEEPLSMRLKTPKGTSSHWTFAGIPDLVVRDLEDGRIKIFDHKTTRTASRERYTAELELDPQSRGYVMLWAMTHDGEEADFVWDVQRAVLPAEPYGLVCRKCNAKVKAGGQADPKCPDCRGTNVSGLSQAKDVDTTPAKYREAIAKYTHLNINDYTDLLARLDAKADSWLYRIELGYSTSELADFHAEAYEVTREISEAGYWTRNLGGCFAPGRVCAYRFLCLAEGNAGKVDEARRAFRQRKPGAVELQERTDEPNGDMLPF